METHFLEESATAMVPSARSRSTSSPLIGSISGRNGPRRLGRHCVRPLYLGKLLVLQLNTGQGSRSHPKVRPALDLAIDCDAMSSIGYVNQEPREEKQAQMSHDSPVSLATLYPLLPIPETPYYA